MDNKTFEIRLVKYKGKRIVYKMQVEIIHRSEQTIRFRISAGTKSITMEKLLLKNKGQWKIRETNFEIKGSPKDIAMTVMEIQDAIEFYLARRIKPVNNFKNK